MGIDDEPLGYENKKKTFLMLDKETSDDNGARQKRESHSSHSEYQWDLPRSILPLLQETHDGSRGRYSTSSLGS